MKEDQFNKFDNLANDVYGKHEVLPENIKVLKEDSFAEPVEGYTKDDWMKIDYRKRRYLTLKLKKKAAAAGGPPVQMIRPVKAPVTQQVEPSMAEPESEIDQEPVDTDVDDTEQEPAVPELNTPAQGKYDDAVATFVSSNPGTTKQDLFDFLSREFGDVLNTDSAVNRVVDNSIADGVVNVDDSGVLSVDSDETAEPDETEIVKAPVVDKDAERKRLVNKFLQWRRAKATDTDTSTDEDDTADEDEDEDVKPADRVLKNRGFRGLKRSGVEDYESETGDQD